VMLVKAYAQFEEISCKKVAFHIGDIPTRLKWDTTFSDFKLIESDIDGCEIIYCLLKAPFPVANRDFLQWRRTETDATDTTKIMMRSASHPSIPEKNGVIRAETLISGYIIEPKSPTSTSLFILAQTDVKGYIPKWIVNAGAARSPIQWVENLRKACLSSRM